MNGFYVSLVFFGVLLVIFSLICIFLDKKKVFSFIKNYDEKKQELAEIINDAEQMIEELNRFSDYIVNQMDLKNEELSKNLKIAEEKISSLSERARVICNEAGGIAHQERVECREPATEVSAAEVSAPDIIPVAVAVNGRAIDTAGTAAAAYFKFSSDFAVENTDFDVPGFKNSTPQKLPAKKSEKVIPINNKYSEVIRLSQEGMQGLEIARSLNMGKGEVELILGLRK